MAKSNKLIYLTNTLEAIQQFAKFIFTEFLLNQFVFSFIIKVKYDILDNSY
jgi:hypothetical protein